MTTYDSELEDANQILKKLKVGGDGPYLFSHSMHPLNGAGVQLLRYGVTVKHGRNAVTYDGGHGMSWLGDFENDVKAGRL